MPQTIFVTKTQRAAAQARVKIDRAHGRTTPWSVVKIANAQPAAESEQFPAEPPSDEPVQ